MRLLTEQPHTNNNLTTTNFSFSGPQTRSSLVEPAALLWDFFLNRHMIPKLAGTIAS